MNGTPSLPFLSRSPKSKLYKHSQYHLDNTTTSKKHLRCVYVLQERNTHDTVETNISTSTDGKVQVPEGVLANSLVSDGLDDRDIERVNGDSLATEDELQLSSLVTGDGPDTISLVQLRSVDAAIDKFYSCWRELGEGETGIQNHDGLAGGSLRDGRLVELELLSVDQHLVHLDTPPRLGGDVVQLSRGTGQLGLLSNGLEFRVIFTNGENTLLITSGIIGTAKENSE